MKKALLLLLITLLFALAGCGGGQPTPTPPPSAVEQPTPTSPPSAVAEAIPTNTNTPIPPTATHAPTPVPIDTPTATPVPADTPTPTDAPTHTPVAVVTPTSTDTPTVTATATPTELSFAVEYLGCKPHDFKLGSVKGQVFYRQGSVIPGAQVGIWIDGHYWDNPANPATANQDGWYEWVLARHQVVRFVALYIDGQEVAIYPQDLEVRAISWCFQHVNFGQQ